VSRRELSTVLAMLIRPVSWACGGAE